MIDPSAVTDAAASIVPVAESGLWEAPWDSHTLSSLWDDEFHTLIYAALGLVGAYVTQVPPPPNHSASRRTILITRSCRLVTQGADVLEDPFSDDDFEDKPRGARKELRSTDDDSFFR